MIVRIEKMVQTRAQAGREQSSRPVASLGASTPQSGNLPLQGHPARGGADVPQAATGLEGDLVNGACAESANNLVIKKCGRRRCAICVIFKG